VDIINPLKSFAGDNGANTNNTYAYNSTSTPPAPPASTGGSTPASTESVGLLAANELGLYDMSGNVWQWCWDAWDRSAGYNNGSGGPVTDPTYNGQVWASGFSRVLRGGSWYEGASHAAVACRSSDGPTYEDAILGFRVVRP
jgi:sulfatase modifying factor 1